MKELYPLGRCLIMRVLFVLYFVAFYVAAVAQTSINFGASGLAGENISNPTALQFGPDSRLYVAVQAGSIYAFTVKKNGPNNYSITSTEIIQQIRSIPNHNDDGILNTSVTTRQVTGLLVAGTRTNPVIYVTSSDPRIGGGGTAGDLNLDTNSGIISSLFWNGTAWVKTDIVKGLPRSEENHSNNGLTLDAATNTLYVAQGGHTNAGSPSNNFAFLTEYALSAAILKVDLNKINSDFGGSYTLPTLDDPTRANSGLNGADINDPWGGNDGINQAKLVANGPVQIYSPGYRNSYDLLITKSPGKAGRMYTIDNGANGGWGGYPDKEGSPDVTNNYVAGEPGSTTPGLNDAKVNNLDNLHLVSAPGIPPIYGGHPNPIRANPSGAGIYTFNNVTGAGSFSLQPTSDWPPVPVSMANPVEADFRNPGVNDGALYTWDASTNGIAEYTSAGFFNGEMAGDLIAASFDGNIYRIKLNSTGTAVANVSVLAGGFGSQPLDVTTQGDNDIFPGTIWAATYGASSITVFEPVIPSGEWNNVVYTSSGFTPPVRHENGFVEVNGKFYLIGGRVEKNVNIFDPLTKTWSLGASSPIELHHFQAAVYNQEIYVICAMTGAYPNEVPVQNVYKYNPQSNLWTIGATIPVNRRRGSSGVVLYNNKFYVIGGIQNGHIDGWVSWVDEFDPVTGGWKVLSDAPVARDHFMAALINGKIYAVAGRQTHYPDFAANTIAQVDVYDILANTWSTPTQLPTPRGAPGVSYINGELVVAGGEVSTSTEALSVVEAYNPVTNSWKTNSSLNIGRHATQMISYQGSLYLCAGSTTQGGNGQTNTMSAAAYAVNCTGDNTNFTIDDDKDGYSNGDENINGTDPCSAASKPEDFDMDGLSNLTDPDDDNDGLSDATDKFALDKFNGTTTNLPLDYPFLNGNPGFGLFGLGFTGLMTNNITDYKDNFDLKKPNLVMGGAVGIATAPAETGDPRTNDQKYAFQFGVNVNQSISPFTIQGKILGSSFFDGASGSQLGAQSQGIYFGTGDQDNYLKLVLHANNGNPGFQILIENNGVVTLETMYPISNILSASAIDLFIDINPATGSAQCKYQTTDAGSPVNIGPPLTMTGNILNVLQNNNAVAIGLIASAGNMVPFTASWDYLKVNSTLKQSLTEVIRLNSGGPNLQFGTELWKADQYFTGGSTYKTSSPITNTTNDALYQTERYGNITYNIPVPQSGKYTVELNFAELYHNSSGARVFDVNIESGQFQLQNIDLYKNYGGKFAASIIKAQNVQVNDGFITIRFVKVVDYPKVSGIAVFLQSEDLQVNQPPVVNKPADQTIVSGQSWSYQVVASDPDAGSVLTYSATNLPASLTINSTTGLISGTVSAAAGSYNVNLAVKDQQNLTATSSFIISVSEVVSNLPPVISKPADITLVNGQTWSYQVVASDPDSAAVLTYSAGNLPSSLAMNVNTGLITGNVSAAAGLYTVNLSVKDQQGLTASTSFVISVTSASALTEVIRINSGGPNLQFGNELWKADQYFTGGSTYKTSSPISNTTNDPLYQTERYGNITYNIPVPQSGKYTVELNFAELYHNSAGARVFDVDIESGQFQLQNIDLYKDYGGKFAASIIKAQNVQVNDGFITIRFIKRIDYPKISGIAVFLQSSSPVSLQTAPLMASTPFALNKPFPQILKPSESTLISGEFWKYQVQASGGNTVGNMIFSASGLPPSLTIDGSTGIISGKISAAAGVYNVALATKDGEAVGTQHFLITVISAIYPNPAKNRFSVMLNIRETGRWNGVLYNNLGQGYQLLNQDLSKGFRTLDLDLTSLNLNPGLYYLILTSDKNDKLTHKIILE